MLSLIVARARNGAIGKDGDIPWSLPEDLKFFQRETTGGAITMRPCGARPAGGLGPLRG